MLESRFYSKVCDTPPRDLRAGELALLGDIRDHEIAHRRFLKRSLQVLREEVPASVWPGIDFTSRAVVRSERAASFGRIGSSHTYASSTPGGGVRRPLPNRIELRGEPKDMMLFDTPAGTSGANRMTHNLVIQGALGLTF